MPRSRDLPSQRRPHLHQDHQVQKSSLTGCILQLPVHLFSELSLIR
ncbi:hypothetical protein [Acaryochloris marina]|nr:hypothetical protein [Acaryochloris marina]QUY41973.1 hypothetical protein I1H34_22600 [Acaryochloris marina S15]